jgi:hypothetical protein
MAADRDDKVSTVIGIGSLSDVIRQLRHSTQMPAAALQVVHIELCTFTLLLPFISFVRVTIVIQLFVDLFLKLFVLLVLFSPF